MKPYIGILPSYNEESEQIFLNNSYINGIINSGGIPVVLPLLQNEEVISENLLRIDGIIFSGGADIDPKYYGKENKGKSKGICYFRDECENAYINFALKADIPILGICRGMQALNVFCGGNLYQDIPTEYNTETVHTLEKPAVAFHNINVIEDTPLFDMVKRVSFCTNSYHHQAVKDVAPYFSVAALSEDGIIESIYHNSKRFVLGVQWHPERNQDKIPENKAILDGFVKICAAMKG